jgi:hypothetical protein
MAKGNSIYLHVLDWADETLALPPLALGRQITGSAVLTGGNATIFAASGEDFVRVTTSGKKENGERAVGTALDKASPAYPALRAGRNYVGLTTLFGKQFITQYEPVRDASAQKGSALSWAGKSIAATRWSSSNTWIGSARSMWAKGLKRAVRPSGASGSNRWTVWPASAR